mmetsp:Transcript_79709/g.221835  ORF Transcript_79709/g.221835 Transcript_79709/m.221835 type:complete len:115 (-) Transcript_79709:99-443(-)
MDYLYEKKSEEQLAREAEEIKEKEKAQGPKNMALKIGGIFGYALGVGVGPLVVAGLLGLPVSALGVLGAGTIGALGGAASAYVLYDRGHVDESAGLAGAAIGGLAFGVPITFVL